MRRYQQSLLIASLIISAPSLFICFIGIIKPSAFNLMCGTGILALWWGTYIFCKKGTKLAFWLSFGLVNLFWWPLLWLTANRIMFVIKNSGMERADGAGSPLAFLIGLVSEQLFFLPLCLPMLFGLLFIKKPNKEK